MKSKLDDYLKVKAIVNDFLKNDKPTISGLCIKLNCVPNTLWAFISKNPDSPVTTLLINAYQHIINTFETKLYDRGSCVPAIFYLKTVRRLGYRWNDREDKPEGYDDTNAKSNKKIKFEYEIVTREDKREDNNNENENIKTTI